MQIQQKNIVCIEKSLGKWNAFDKLQVYMNRQTPHGIFCQLFFAKLRQKIIYKDDPKILYIFDIESI